LKTIDHNKLSWRRSEPTTAEMFMEEEVDAHLCNYEPKISIPAIFYPAISFFINLLRVMSEYLKKGEKPVNSQLIITTMLQQLAIGQKN
jgi:hypothetical protein